MIIHSDWHIHSEASYDASLPLGEIARGARQFGFRRIGITDHANYNDTKFIGDLDASAASVKAAQKEHPEFVLGVELTPIAKPQFDYIAKTVTRDGYVPSATSVPYDIELAVSKEALMARCVRYAIGASHWCVDGVTESPTRDEIIREWYRQQLWLACDERVTILGHPWYHGKGLWYEDFSVIPRSMNMDIAAALKENGKYAECYADFFCIPITFGSDSHNAYEATYLRAEEYLIRAGFRDGDIVEVREESLWK